VHYRIDDGALTKKPCVFRDQIGPDFGMHHRASGARTIPCNNNNQQQPTTTNNNQQQPTTTNNNQQQPTTTNNNQQQPTPNNTKQHQTTPNNTKQHQTTPNNTKQHQQQMKRFGSYCNTDVDDNGESITCRGGEHRRRRHGTPSIGPGHD
jgi:hypothetical protein